MSPSRVVMYVATTGTFSVYYSGVIVMTVVRLFTVDGRYENQCQ